MKWVVFGPHKVATKSIATSLTKKVRTQRTHSVNEFKNWTVSPGDVVITGIRDPPCLRLSAFFQDKTRFTPDIDRDTICPADMYELFKKIDWSNYPFADIDVYMNALHDRFGTDFRTVPWKDPRFHYIEANGVLVVVYRQEFLDDKLFLDIWNLTSSPKPAPALERKNIGENKGYAQLYKQVKELHNLQHQDRPEWYVHKFM